MAQIRIRSIYSGPAKQAQRAATPLIIVSLCVCVCVCGAGVGPKLTNDTKSNIINCFIFNYCINIWRDHRSDIIDRGSFVLHLVDEKTVYRCG